VAERTIHFNFGGWHGSTDKVGASHTATEWDFAEGSTLNAFSEYLTLQNPNSSATPVTLQYFTDSGGHPVKSLTLPANSRTTVEVFSGNLQDVTACVPSAAGANCGVGRGIGGVSVTVRSSSGAIVVERPFYVNHFSFGAGAISDGHDAFGANAPATQWNFAEGTTLPGFNEYLTLQNPNASAANVTLRYQTNVGSVLYRSVQIPLESRFTIPVWQTSYGPGLDLAGVSVQITSDKPIVAERPMYMVHDFGTGPVAGAHVVVGSTGLSQSFAFGAASTVYGENDFLTIQNPATVAAGVTITYFTNTGPIQRKLTVDANTRKTIEIWDTTQGAGPGQDIIGITVQADQPVLVEKPAYSSNPATYGATDTLGTDAF
jgi:hypothetical protein